MKRSIVTALLVFSLAFAASAQAGATTYYASSSWSPGMGGGSSFSSSWWMNGFYRPSGFDITVAFIDNVTYGWHSTVRAKGVQSTYAHWLTSDVKKAHCHANVSGGYGVCNAYN
jgi:hypothetical protein